MTEHDILLAGRYSEWEYYNSDHAFIAGQKAAMQVAELTENQMLAAGLVAQAETGKLRHL